MSFGKNRVQHHDFYWMFYRFDNFDCYFNEKGRELARYTSAQALSKIAEIEDFFDYRLERRLMLIVYDKHAEFRQSNIGLSMEEANPYNIGGRSNTIENKVMLYNEGDRRLYDNQISEAIAESVIGEMFADAPTRERTSRSGTIDLPEWYLRGLVSWVAGSWDFHTENRVREGFVSGRFRRLNSLEYDDAVIAGHSFWKYIADNYGERLIPNIVYLARVNRNINDAFLYVLGIKLRDLIEEWEEYYTEYFRDLEIKDDSGGDIFIRARREQIIQTVRMSPERQHIAWVTNDWGRRRIWLYDESEGRMRIIFSREPRLEQVLDQTYPAIAWHPNGRILSFVNEEEGGLRLYFYDIDDGEMQSLRLIHFEKVLSFTYSPDGTRLAMSAVRDGMTDIFIHNIASGTSDRITHDIADNIDPIFLSSRPENIIFSSNRLSPELTNRGDPQEDRGRVFNLYTYDLNSRENSLTPVTDEMFYDRIMPRETTDGGISFIGNDNGIYNRYVGEFDSVISHIDTIAHYRHFIRAAPTTNYGYHLLDYDLRPGSEKIPEIQFFDNRYHLFISDTGQPPVDSSEMVSTNYRAERDQMLHKADSVDKLREWLLEEDRRRRDTLTKPYYQYFVTDEPIDVNQYIFEVEKKNYYEQKWRSDYMDIDLDTTRLSYPPVRIYMTSFYNNFVASQIDFSFLNNSYQIYSGGAPYFNPGLSMLTQVGAIDLFENYRLTGGFRFSGNFDSNEYLISFENLRNRINRQLIYHRQSYSADSDRALLKIHSNNLFHSWLYPFHEALSVKGTVSYRHDRYVHLATDIASLEEPDINRHWGSLKGELIFDNTRHRSVNIYYGTRFKLFAEYYREITESRSDMFVVGADFRHYTRIHRELIWANRFAASSSFGPTRLIYYLGGVDNWLGFLMTSQPMFDNTIPVDQTKNYGFQALATNMRGFTQNIRNGPNFMLINSEIRWPFIRYFAGRPLRSNFLNSIQVVGFGDIGTAWSGLHPWSGENAYDTEIIERGPIKVVLDTNRDPIVGGVGVGARAEIFGYFVRADYAWGIENRIVLPPLFYLSFSLDF